MRSGVRVYGNNIRNGDQGIVIWANVRGLKIWRNHFSSLRIGVQHHHSSGTVITDNTASSVRYRVYAEIDAQPVRVRQQLVARRRHAARGRAVRGLSRGRRGRTRSAPR